MNLRSLSMNLRSLHFYELRVCIYVYEFTKYEFTWIYVNVNYIGMNLFNLIPHDLIHL
jgi:hypothetical protein